MQSKIKIRKSNHRLIFIMFFVAATVPFSGAILLVAQAQSIPDLQAQLNVKQSISSFNFTRDLTVGSRGDDVKALQQFLNSHGVQVSVSGPGSSGNETAYFGGATKAALAKWQAANGVSPAAGYFGPKSRSFVQAMSVNSGSSSSLPIPASPVSSSGGLASSISSQNPQQASLPAGQAVPGLPVRLRIPKINVDAPIVPVGIMPDGAMEAPVGPRNVGWFKFGPRPGDSGSAVMAGHYGRWKSGEGSVFDNLNKLSKGDKLYVEDEKGVTTGFVVREIKSYDPNDDASAVFGSNDGKMHLNLVTCEGIWIPDKKTYTDRLVVFTDIE